MMKEYICSLIGMICREGEIDDFEKINEIEKND